MINSNSINDLRDDVAHNCLVWIERCKEAGLNVLVTQTLRDDDYQAFLYAQGRTRAGSIITNSKVTTFHGVGLAFDFCKNIRGHEYDDILFFAKAAAIAKDLGFSWGGDWKSFVDRPHLQWDGHGKYSGTMVRNGGKPRNMEEHMTRAEFASMMEYYLDEQRKKAVSKWAKPEWDKATADKIVDGTAPQGLITRQEVAAMILRKK